MTETDDRLIGELRQRLAESVARLAELEAIAIDALIAGKGDRDVAALEVKKRECGERIAALGKAIKQLEHQRQTDAQQRMLAQTMAFVAPLTASFDEATAKLALPPYTGPMRDLTPETVPAKKVFRWPGNPKEQGGNRWNERAR
jgi:hypothetical protein